MLAAIILAALAFATPGKYMYAYTSASGGEAAADVWIYGTAQGIVVHEEMRHGTPIATTDQHFDRDLGLNWYLGADTNGSQLLMKVFWPIRGPWWAREWMSGKKSDIQLDVYRPGCILAYDRGLASSVLLPSLFDSGRSGVCVFIDVEHATAIRANVERVAPRVRPRDAAPSDLEMTVEIGSITEKLWYDPKTLIPDYIDLGTGASATLSATTGEQ